jgi:hypothetical protein
MQSDGRKWETGWNGGRAVDGFEFRSGRVRRRKKQCDVRQSACYAGRRSANYRGRQPVKVRCPATLIKKAPTFSPRAELAQVEKEEINKYYGRSRAGGRTNSINELRPEEAVGSQDSQEESREEGKSERSVGDRQQIENGELSFFDQNGFVTDSMSEVDASQELLRVQKEAKARNREDRNKSGSLD